MKPVDTLALTLALTKVWRCWLHIDYDDKLTCIRHVTCPMVYIIIFSPHQITADVWQLHKKKSPSSYRLLSSQGNNLAFQYEKFSVCKNKHQTAVNQYKMHPANLVSQTTRNLCLYSLSGKTSTQSREIGRCSDRIALKLDRHLLPVKFQSDWESLNPNLAASRLHELLR